MKMMMKIMILIIIKKDNLIKKENEMVNMEGNDNDK